MTTQETPEPGTEAGRRLLQGWGGQAKPSVREVLAIEAEARAAVLAEIKKHVYSLRVEEHGPVDWARNGVLSDILAFLDTDGLSDGGPTDG